VNENLNHFGYAINSEFAQHVTTIYNVLLFSLKTTPSHWIEHFTPTRATDTENQEAALSLIGYQWQFQLVQRFGTHLIAPKSERTNPW